MSRLADLLTGMDGRAPGPASGGTGTPHLKIATASSPRRYPRVLRATIPVIVVVMFAVGGFVVLRPGVARLTAAPVPPHVAPLRPAPRVDVAASRDAQFIALRAKGLLAARDDLAEGTALVRKALDLKPADGETWNTLGVLLALQGEVSQSMDAFNRALSLEPDHAEAHRNLAVALDRQGRPREAAVHYRAYLRLCAASDPGRADVRRRLMEVSVPGAEKQSTLRGAGDGEPREPSRESVERPTASASANRAGASGSE